MLRNLYDRVMALAAHRLAVWWLMLVSFIESSVFPIPPDVMLVPMILAKRAKAWFYAAMTTISSVLGGAAGYAIGYFFFELVGQPILEFYGKTDAFDEFASGYNAYGAWIVLFAGITPFPYKVITIASGVTGLSFPIFMLSSLVARGLRFYLVAALLYWFGPPIRSFIERRLGLVTFAFFVALFGGFLALRYI
ncbi:YqaA family protein [Dichotomicrobium thermohalophilum]|uniref:Membrane protein YqaA with SNARE-associated domain n=1 Tax=Dichotomicrobium thermohalophilum TaxID=933063 RepID=A0A397Q4W2_9HYPH|nr:YqaA family protein [Dichotomicrobium thermohalophilum]RIA55983.1 membrane protein YqaA with SNARE-associated domain [Dichotomicrobium thermohalophilum]